MLTALRSTDDLVPYAIDVDELPAIMREELADSLDLGPSERSAKRLRAALGDRENVRVLLRSFPGYALLLLEAMCVSAGTISRAELADAMKGRRLDPKVMPMAVDFLVGHGLVVRTRRGGSEEITLVAPRARAVAELVLGLGVPAEVPPEPPRDRDLLDDERSVLALTTLTAHRKLKWTREGLPNKTSLKTFVRALGPDDARVERFLHRAFRARLLDEASDGTIRPGVRRARRAAESGIAHPRDSLLGNISAALPEKGWVAAAALLSRLRVFAVHTIEDVRTRCAGHFALREHRGEWFVARAERPVERTGDGHVTPSFEVMLGPDAHPDIVVLVGLFAELVRLDRVLTFKITEASVLAGLRSGLSLDDFLVALTAVGRHGVPENVSSTVKDFAARAARVRPVWAIEVPLAAAEAVTREFGPAMIGAPKPGLLLVSADVSEGDVALTLQRAGVRTCTLVERALVDDEHAEVAPRPPPGPLAPDSVLREVVARERVSGFADSVRIFESAFPRMRAGAGMDAEQVLRAALDEMRTNNAPPMVRKTFEALGALIQGVPRQLAEWRERLPRRFADEARLAIVNPAVLVPFAALPDDARREVLASATSWPVLLELCEHHLSRGRVRPEAPRVIANFGQAWRAEAPARTVDEDGPDEFSRRIEPGPTFESHLRRLIEEGAVATVVMRSTGRELDVRFIAPTSVIRRGNEPTLLAEDVETGEDLALPFSKIRWLEVDADELEPDGLDAQLPGNPDAEDLRATPARTARVVGRNDPCDCGSGKKYKRCHGLQ